MKDSCTAPGGILSPMTPLGAGAGAGAGAGVGVVLVVGGTALLVEDAFLTACKQEINVCTYIHNVCTYVYIHTYIRTCIRTCVHVCMHACVHTYIHTLLCVQCIVALYSHYRGVLLHTPIIAIS